jgi:hypothetical protein
MGDRNDNEAQKDKASNRAQKMYDIAGYQYHGEGENVAIVQAMLTRLERRGPDDGGIAMAGPLFSAMAVSPS